MNIVLLGAAGFIGTNLTIALAKDPMNILRLVDKDRSYFADIEVMNSERVTVIESPLEVNTNFDELVEGQDIVYHLVSTTVPATSNESIAQELISNIVFSVNLFEACIRCGVKKVVFISSGGAVYGKGAESPLDEEMDTNPICAYGLQKIITEKLLAFYRYMFGLDYRITRLANPYGPYQRPDGVVGAVATFTYKALKGEEISVFGDGSVVRDFIYIDDAIRAILNIVNGENIHRVFNLGCGHGTSIKELIKTIQDSLNVNVDVSYQKARKVDVPVNYLDISRYETAYGALHPVSLTDGILKTAAFMKEKYHIT